MIKKKGRSSKAYKPVMQAVISVRFEIWQYLLYQVEIWQAAMSKVKRINVYSLKYVLVLL